MSKLPKNSHLPLILAIDTSCDDTSAAVTCSSIVLSNVVASQIQLHKQYGGVFPTVAKQAHKENIEPVIAAALKKAGVSLADLAAIAVTQGPGLAPALEIGIEKAKALAQETGLPLIPVNHIEGHALSVLVEPRQKAVTLENQYAAAQQKLAGQQFPVLAVVVSGGHTEFIKVTELGTYERLGFTVDDAAGEALDKFGRMVDLGYPAGPVIEQFARLGNARAYQFPLPMTTSGNFNLSFSGMKTAARKLTEQMSAQSDLDKQQIFDLCASFQYAVFRAITYKLNKILVKEHFFGIWLGGGVASNVALRNAIRQKIRVFHLALRVPYTKRLCIDNAAMIGVVAGMHFQQHVEQHKSWESAKSVERQPRWEI